MHPFLAIGLPVACLALFAFVIAFNLTPKVQAQRTEGKRKRRSGSSYLSSDSGLSSGDSGGGDSGGGGDGGGC